jgi:hypothetical protein
VSEIRVSLTAGNVRNSHVYVRDHLGFFPPDVLGAPNARDGEGVSVKLRFAGTGEVSRTDIPSDKLIFRARAPWGRFFRHWRLAAGDEVVIAEAGTRSYQVRPAQATVAFAEGARVEVRPNRGTTGGAGQPSRARLAAAKPVRTLEARDAERPQAGALFQRFHPVLLELAERGAEDVLDEELLLYRDAEIETFFAPFDHLNGAASLVLIGITPGATQMRNTIRTLPSEPHARKESLDATRWRAQRAGSFSGQMRARLAWLLDELGVPARLEAESASALLENGSLVRTTSCVRYPTFRLVGQRNWNGTKPGLLQHPETRAYVFEVLAVELAALPGALVMPLGQHAGEALDLLIGAGLVEANRCCIGTPHPSPANAGMVQQFAERRAGLSERVANWLG